MFLGIEIGGTKLQLGVGSGESVQIERLDRLRVDAARGAQGILEQIERVGRELIAAHGVTGVGIGFGGPIDSATGRVITSHQVGGWDGFPLCDWCSERLGLPCALGNDCDSAALAEARFGAGRGKRMVFYVTVGTGIGGGLIVDGRLHGRNRPASAEIGHLHPAGFDRASQVTVESIASGPSIEAAVKWAIGQAASTPSTDAVDLLQAGGGGIDSITAQIIADAARGGNQLACEAIGRAVQCLGWAVAQVVTLLAPEVVVVGGGVSLMGEGLFFVPLRAAVRRHVFGPLADSFDVVPAALGEEVVVHGAIALAAGVEE